MPSIALIGAGPVGTLLAAALLHNGVAFHWVVRSEQRQRELTGGLRLSWEREVELPLESATFVDFAFELPPCDWYLLAVKAQHVLPLVSELMPYPGGHVLAVANGLHDGPFHLGVLHGGARLASGALHTAAGNRLYAGPLGEVADRSHELLNMLPAPWLDVEPVRDAFDRMWRKAALNCVVNPLTALLDCDNGYLAPLLDSPLVSGLLDELGRAMYRDSEERLASGPGELRGELADLLAVTAGNSSSMREDLRAGRETEIDYLNLAVARRAKMHGLDCRLNAEIGRMVQLMANSGGS